MKWLCRPSHSIHNVCRVRSLWILGVVSVSLVMLFKLCRSPGEIILIESDLDQERRLFLDSLQPLILMWTTVWRENVDASAVSDSVCDNAQIRCRITTDRRAMSEASVLLFHARDLSRRDLPSYKYKNQLWILWNREAPGNTPLDLLNELGFVFDGHLTYRSRSSIAVPYGYFRNVTNKIAANELDSDLLEKRFNHQQGAVWLVSNCRTESNRETYVETLKKFYPVAVLGGCGEHECSRSSHVSCMKDLSDKYMFYLAFENSICPEYVTEKLYKALTYQIVPVVLSGARAPFLNSLKAFVDATQLTPDQLATKLHAISRNFTEYRSYFEWKRNFTAYSDIDPFCSLCDSLLQKPEQFTNRTKLNVGRFFSEEHKSCSRWNPATYTFKTIDANLSPDDDVR